MFKNLRLQNHGFPKRVRKIHRLTRQQRKLGKKRRQTQVYCRNILLNLPVIRVMLSEIAVYAANEEWWFCVLISSAETGNSSISYLIQAHRSKMVQRKELFYIFSIHSINVLLIVRRKLFAFQFERVCHQASLRCPRIRTQADFYWDFKLLQIGCKKTK